jgi:hypothetical protein
MRFSLSPEIIAKARFMPGDKVDILFDQDARAGLIKRTSIGGWSLSQTPASQRFSIKLTWREGLPTIANTDGCTDVQVTDEGIIFKFPDGASFDHNARAEPVPVTAEDEPIGTQRRFPSIQVMRL